jgi:mono/diheme cytochrome c family protein
MKTIRPFLCASSLAGLAVVCLLAFAVQPGQAQKTGPKNGKLVYAPLAEVPEQARARQNPLEKDPDAVAAGGKLFQQHCVECHGMKAEGTKRGPSLLKEEVRQATPGMLFWILTNGVVRHGMPVWSKLPEPERWQIVAFLTSFRAQGTEQAPASAKEQFSRLR